MWQAFASFFLYPFRFCLDLPHLCVITLGMNTDRNAYYVAKLKDSLDTRQKENRSYSMRAYARDLGINPSSLSQILRGKRGIPVSKVGIIADRLQLNPKERTVFIESLYRSKTSIDEIKIDSLDNRFIVDNSYSKVLSEWEHCAVLTLFNLTNFTVNHRSISDRLGITFSRARRVLDNLETAGLISVDASGRLAKTYPDIKTTEDIKSIALRKGHLENLDIAKLKLEEIEVDLRDFSATTVAVDLEQLSEAKTIIREFRQKMTSLMRNGRKKTEVYQLAIQFYPLTKK